jgi:hypothetical protein
MKKKKKKFFFSIFKFNRLYFIKKNKIFIEICMGIINS